MIPEIVVVNLPSPFLEDQLWIYPLGILNFVTYLKHEGYSVGVMDLASFNLEPLDLIVRLLRTIKSPIVGVSVTTPQARFLPLFPTAFGKEVKLVVGGPHATIEKFNLQVFGFNVVAGEADTKFIADMVMTSKNYVVCGEPVKDLDSLPFPDRSFFTGYKGPLPVMAHRGCPYSCNFCCKTLSKEVRMRSPENIVEELKELHRRYPDKEEIIFYDETFTFNYDWVDRLCRLIRNSHLRKRLRCSTRGDKLTPEIAWALKSAGFEEVCVGVESGSNKILKNLNKCISVEKSSEAVKICHKAGLKFKAYIMIGCPGEDWDTLTDTYKWIEENKPDTVGLYMYTPLPGSDIWDHKEEYDLEFSLDYDRAYYGGKREELVSVVSTKTLSKHDITCAYWELLRILEKKV